MNKPFFLSTLLSIMLIFSSCLKDKTEPVITLNGDAYMEIAYGSTTSDPGAKATDEKDGDLTANIKSDWNTKVDINKTGEYTVNYTVSDKKGNEATATRKVKVKLNASSYYGEYNTTYTIVGGGTSSNFTSTISPGANDNQFVIFPFFVSNIYLKVNVSGLFGDQLSFSQTDMGLTSTGTGTVENFGKTINLSYSLNSGGGNYYYTQTLTKK